MPNIPGIELVGSFARAFDLISSEYGWDDDVILDKTLRRIRQILAAISLRRRELLKEARLVASWQTRSLAMVMAATGGSEDLMSFAANLTIDKEEYEAFNDSASVVINTEPKTIVHATTQDAATQKNFDSAADRNSFEMLALFAHGVETTPPGQ